MTGHPRHIMILAGEPSGDEHGASLIAELLNQAPDLYITGMGGKAMARAGAELFFHIEKLSAMGLTEVLMQAGTIRQAFHTVRTQIRQTRPQVIILIDYPGFNLRVARFAREHSRARIFYYIPPKIWAWNRSRIRLIRRDVDHVGLIFPFEEKLYRQAKILATYVGNPLMDRYPVVRSCSGLRRKGEGPVIGLLPGSRQTEVRQLLGGMLDAAARIRGRYPGAVFLVSAADAIPRDRIDTAVARSQISDVCEVICGHPDTIFRRSDLVIAASGTVTLEAALCGVPGVLVYRMSPITHAIARLVVTVRHAGLANLIAGRVVMPELLQQAATGPRIFRVATGMLENLPAWQEGLSMVRRLLGSPGASRRAARIGLQLMEETRKQK